MYLSLDDNVKFKVKLLLGVVQCKRLFSIPEEYIIEYKKVNCSLPTPEFDYIKFFYETGDDYEGLRSFLPAVKGNHYYVGGYYDGIEKDLNFQYWNHNSSYIHLRNIFTTYTGALLSENYEYFYLDPDQEWARKHPLGPVIKYVDNVIALGNTQLWAFGHWFHDVLGPLTLFPDDVIKKSYIICAFDSAVPFETLFAFDVEHLMFLSNFRPFQINDLQCIRFLFQYFHCY